MQTKLQSLVEAITNVIIGYAIAVFAQILIFKWYGYTISLRHNLESGIVFTVVSLARSYLLRRAFNRLHEYQNQKALSLYEVVCDKPQDK